MEERIIKIELVQTDLQITWGQCEEITGISTIIFLVFLVTKGKSLRIETEIVKSESWKGILKKSFRNFML